MLLDLVRAPTKSARFRSGSRAQVLKVDAVVQRGYERKFSSMPFPLYRATYSCIPCTERTEIYNTTLMMQDEDLDVYSRLHRLQYPTVEGLSSFHANCKVKSDFKSRPVSTDIIERANSELTRGVTKRAPGLNFSLQSREHLIGQAAGVHVMNNGVHPLAMLKAKASPPVQAVPSVMQMNPLLERGGPSGVAAKDSGVHLLQEPSATRSASSLPRTVEQPEQPVRSNAMQPGETDVPAAGCTRAPTFGTPLRLSSVEAEAGRSHAVPLNPVAEAPSTKYGGSHYILEKNKYMHAAKLAAGRKLTEDDMSEATKNFKTLWARYDKDAVKESFDSWRRGDGTGAEPPKAPATEKPYIPNWAGGNKHAPVTMEELHAHWSKHGWPRNSEVTDANGEFAHCPPASDINFYGASEYIWMARGACYKNVPPSWFPAGNKAELIIGGLLNWIGMMPKAKADAGEVMFMVEVANATDAGDSDADVDRPERYVFQLTDITYSPYVFDLHKSDFQSDAIRRSPALPLPFHVCVASRPCRIAKAKRVWTITLPTSSA